MSSPEEYLHSKDFRVRQAPGELQTQCPFCGDKNKQGHLYVNRDHGAWMCHRCGANGSFYELQVALGDTPDSWHRDFAQKSRVWADMVDLCQDMLLDEPDARRYLHKERGLSSETIAKYRLGWANKDLQGLLLEKWTLGDLKNAGLIHEQNGKNYPLLYNRLIIPYYQRDTVVTVRGKSLLDKSMLQAKDTSIHLFGVDNLRGRQEVIVCEGELDAMYLDQMGHYSCAVPGALNFQEHWVTWFEGARRVFIALDADDAGQKGAVKIEQMLGKRSVILDLPTPEDQATTDVTEYFLRDGHTKDDFNELLDANRGHRLYTFLDGLRERDEMLLVEGIKLGWSDLDLAISPGLLPGQVVTVLAKTGEGKTAFLTQLAHNMSAWQAPRSDKSGPGVPTMVLSLEQTKAEMTNRLERVGKLYNPWVTPKEMGDWYCNFMICDENKIPSTDLPALVDEFVDRIGQPPKLLLVDYLGYWARGFKGKDRYQQTSEAIMELKKIAKDMGVAVIAPHQVSREGKVGQRVEMEWARDSGAVEETSDFLFGMYKPKSGEEEDDALDSLERAEVRLEILKSRHGNKGKQVQMLWAPYSLALVPRGHWEDKIRVEWTMKDSQATYEQVMELHTGGKIYPSALPFKPDPY